MSGNILVVDDDKEIVQAIAINLEQEGFVFLRPTTVWKPWKSL